MEKLIKEHTISNYECDRNETIKIISIFHLLQDMADVHAEKLNIGYTFYKQNHLAWVGRAYHIKIFSLPKIFDKVILETWPCERTALIATREFSIKDVKGNVLIVASSQWAMIDTTKMKPIKFDSFKLTYDVLPQRALESKFAKIQSPQKADYEKQIQIREDDIDSNGHVNNCVYPMWAMEMFDEQFKKNFILNEMEINFKKPVFKQDNIIVAQVQNNSETDFTIRIGTPEKESALIKATFKKRDIESRRIDL
jgi:acyl-ACP thioesterase